MGHEGHILVQAEIARLSLTLASGFGLNAAVSTPFGRIVILSAA